MLAHNQEHITETVLRQSLTVLIANLMINCQSRLVPAAGSIEIAKVNKNVPDVVILGGKASTVPDLAIKRQDLFIALFRTQVVSLILESDSSERRRFRDPAAVIRGYIELLRFTHRGLNFRKPAEVFKQPRLIEPGLCQQQRCSCRLSLFRGPHERGFGPLCVS